MNLYENGNYKYEFHDEDENLFLEFNYFKRTIYIPTDIPINSDQSLETHFVVHHLLSILFCSR